MAPPQFRANRGRHSDRSASLPRIATGSVALVDRGGRETGSVTSSGSYSVFAGFRFAAEVIFVAVRWYLRVWTVLP